MRLNYLFTEQRCALLKAGAFALAVLALAACGNKAAPPAPPPPEVAVIKAVAHRSRVQDYVGQTEAVDTVEIARA